MLKKPNAGWLFSYLVIIICLFLVIAVIIGVYSTSLRKETKEFNEFVFERVTDSLNEVLTDVNTLHQLLLKNEKLEQIIKLPGMRYATKTSHELMNELDSYNSMATNVEHFFIYLRDENLVISHRGIVKDKIFYNYFFNTGSIDFEEWKSKFSNFNKNEYISMKCLNNDEKLINSVGFLFNITDDNDNAIGVILCDENNFVKNIEGIEWKSKCDLYLYNGIGKLILCRKTFDSGYTPKTLKEAEKYLQKRNLVYKGNISAGNYYWQLLCVVPKSAVNVSLYITQCAIVLLLILSVIVLFFLLKYLIKMNKKPIQTVLSLFGVTAQKDEYTTLNTLIKNTLMEKDNLHNDLKKRDKELRNIAISKIIKGNMPRRELTEYNIRFHNGSYALVLFYLEDLSTFFPNDDDMPNFERSYNLRYNINNVMEELCSDENISVYTTEIDSYFVCLANFDGNSTMKAFSEIVEKCVDFLNTSFNIELKFSISDIYDMFSELPVAYAQVERTLEDTLYAENNAGDCEDCAQEIQQPFAFDMRSEERLAHFIKIGSTQEALAQASLLFNELGKPGKYSPDYIRRSVLDLNFTVTKCAGEILRESSIIEAGISLCKNISDTTALSKIQSKTENYIESVCENVIMLSKKKKHSKCNSGEIKAYVSDHMADFGLCATSIGAYFGLTPIYISKLFKKETGESLTEYISIKRIERANELLAEGKYSAREVSKMVGFSNERTFYRAQKKYKNNIE